ncbi:MAG: hypothetical protein WDO69_21975 [Pseudomonadota bacterium]
MNSSQRFRFPTVLSSVAVQIFLTFLVIYAITSSGGLEVTDGETRYRTAQSWLDGNGGALSSGPGPVDVPGRDGRNYSIYGPFQSVLMTPIVAIVRRVAHGNSDPLFKLAFGVVIIPMISALSLAVLFRALRSLRFSERAAFCTVALIGLATPMWHYGRSGQEENIIGLAFAFYLWGMGQLFVGRFAGLKLIALAAGIIFATRWSYVPTLAIILIPVVLFLWQRRTEWRAWWQQLAISAAIGSTVVGAVCGYNIYRFGRPFETGYGLYFKTHPLPPFFTFDQAPNHIAALALSPYRGLLWFCPSLLILFGLSKLRKNRTETLLWKATLAAWLFTWLFIGCFSYWNAGPAWAPRYLVALIVLLAPAFASVFASGQRWRVVIAISFLIQFCSTLLPSSSEDYVYVTRNLEHPGACTPWSCDCSALCLRGPWALRAIGNTISSRDLPVIELTQAGQAPGGISPLETSDFNSVYWWPVRAAYRAHVLSPAAAFAICMLVLGAALGALGFFYRRLPDSANIAAVALASEH